MIKNFTDENNKYTQLFAIIIYSYAKTDVNY
jgi:hypothetical protein